MAIDHNAPGIALDPVDVTRADWESLEKIDLGTDLIQIMYPPLVPEPHVSGKVTRIPISGEACTPDQLERIRRGLSEGVEALSDRYGVTVPEEDVVQVGSELGGNAIRPLENRWLTDMALEYHHPRAKLMGLIGRRRAGWLAIMASDNQPGFQEDPERGDYHRGFFVIRELSASLGYFLNGDGKTVFATFEATPLPVPPIRERARLALSAMIGRFSDSVV